MKVTKNMKNRINKYTAGTQSLLLATGAFAAAQDTDATVVPLSLPGTILNHTFDLTNGTQYVDYAVYGFGVNGTLRFYGFDNGITVKIVGLVPMAQVYVKTNTNSFQNYDAKIFNPGDLVSTISDVTGGYNTINYNLTSIHFNGNERSPWTSAHSDVALGFVTQSNHAGFININWDAANNAMTVLGGAYENVSGLAITVTSAIPEPADYAAALGLGALGLAYYRNRRNLKQRAKIKSIN